MLIAVEINWFEDVKEHTEWDDDSKRILEKLWNADKDDDAFECIENHFDGEAPEEGEVRDYINNELLDDMGITESELDERIRKIENGEDLDDDE